jgi:hypothetical protein
MHTDGREMNLPTPYVVAYAEDLFFANGIPAVSSVIIRKIRG